MKMHLLVASIGLLALACVCHANEDPTVSLTGVQDLTPETFDQYVNGRKHALVEFYAPWCGHCKRMTPEFKRLGEKIAGDGKLSSRVVVAKVDADKHRELGNRFGIKGFPTILYFSRGKPVDSHSPYQGARSYAEFLSFIEEQLEKDKGFARSDAFDALATKFLGAAEDARAAIVDEVKTAAAALSGDGKANADLYERYMQKAVTKGIEYFQKEYERLDRIISSGSASPTKLAEAARKSSVLTAFIPELNEDAAAEEEAEEVEEEASEGEEAFPEEAAEDEPLEEEIAEEAVLQEEAAAAEE